MKNELLTLVHAVTKLALRLSDFAEYSIRRSMRQDAAISAIAHATLPQDGASRVMEILTGDPEYPNSIPIAMEMLVPEPVRVKRIAKAKSLPETERSRRQRILKIPELATEVREIRKGIQKDNPNKGRHDGPTL